MAPKDAAAGFDDSVGEKSVELSRQINKLKKATLEEKEDSHGGNQFIRQIGNRTFYLNDKGIWIESTFEPEKTKPIDVKIFSHHYFDIIQKNPFIGKFMVLRHLIVEANNNWYRIGP